MSSGVRSSCTQCLEQCRPADLKAFAACHKHRLCRGCLGALVARLPEHRRAMGVAADQCPVCDESRRRLGAKVRFDIWTEQTAGKVQCVECEHYGSGAVMKCRHSYCLPCLRKLPRSFQSRTVSGDLARRCRGCEVRGAEEAREEARASMQRAADAARAERDEREEQEVHQDRKRRRQAPKPPSVTSTASSKAPSTASASTSTASSKAPSTASASTSTASSKAPSTASAAPKAPKSKRPLTVPVGPSFVKTDVEEEECFQLVRSKAPQSKTTKAVVAAAKDKRRVSFDPHVRHRFISPRETKQRLSMPTAGTSGSSRTSRRSSGLFQPLPQGMIAAMLSEPKTPVDKLRSTHRGWGITTP